VERCYKKIKKSDLRRTILANPGLLQDLIRQYRSKPAEEYDFSNDPTGQIVWYEIAKEFAEDNPINLSRQLNSKEDVFQTVIDICNHFKYLIENNSLNKMFYAKDGKLRHERFMQLLFFGIADSYCEANNIDMNREPNAGRGPVDFKFSKGYNAKVNVEVKHTSNTNLYRGYTTQLPIYNKQENTNLSIYLVLETSKTSNALERIYKLNNKERSKGNRIPEIITADATLKPSASKS